MIVIMRTRLLILAGALALAGCSPESDPTPAGTTAGGAPPASTTKGAAGDDLPDPCSLLTKAEVDAATGATFGEGAINTTVSQALISACDWQSSGVATVQVLVTTVDAFDTSRQTAAQTYGSADDVVVAKAKRAYVVKGGFLIGLDMGEVYLQVSYIATGANGAAAVRDLAGKAAGRLG
jgi:hypothetical protein